MMDEIRSSQQFITFTAVLDLQPFGDNLTLKDITKAKRQKKREGCVGARFIAYITEEQFDQISSDPIMKQHGAFILSPYDKDPYCLFQWDGVCVYDISMKGKKIFMREDVKRVEILPNPLGKDYRGIIVFHDNYEVMATKIKGNTKVEDVIDIGLRFRLQEKELTSQGNDCNHNSGDYILKKEDRYRKKRSSKGTDWMAMR